MFLSMLTSPHRAKGGLPTIPINHRSLDLTAAWSFLSFSQGTLKVDWILKHYHSIPSALVVVLKWPSLDESVDAEWSETGKNQLIAILDMIG